MSQRKIVDYWVEKAEQDIAFAYDNHSAGRLLYAFIKEMKKLMKFE